MSHEGYCYTLEDLQVRAKTGYRWQWRVAYFLGLRGFNVEIGGFEMRRPDETNERFKREVDINISTDLGRAVPVEVKSKDVTFSGPHDWPFPSVVCYSVRKARPDLPVLFISQRTNSIVGLLGDASIRRITTMADTTRGFRYRVYEAPASALLSFDDWCAGMRSRIQVVA